jgi:predicted metal-dependent hydrolase
MKNLHTAGMDFYASLPLLTKVKVTRQRQKNITLRIHPKSGEVQVRAPRHVRKAEIEMFLYEQRDWVAANLNSLAPAIPLLEGVSIPFLGQTRLIKRDPLRVRGVCDDGVHLLVGGKADTLTPRLHKWLVERARREVTMRAKFYATIIGKRINAVTVRDMHSRWGSCTRAAGESGGKLSFNWRLVLAPMHVLDYVVAHEVAHLLHMNHSHAFWHEVQKLMGDYEPGERWLEIHGHKLMRVGV